MGAAYGFTEYPLLLACVRTTKGNPTTLGKNLTLPLAQNLTPSPPI